MALQQLRFSILYTMLTIENIISLTSSFRFSKWSWWMGRYAPVLCCHLRSVTRSGRVETPNIVYAWSFIWRQTVVWPTERNQIPFVCFLPTLLYVTFYFGHLLVWSIWEAYELYGEQTSRNFPYGWIWLNSWESKENMKATVNFSG